MSTANQGEIMREGRAIGKGRWGMYVSAAVLALAVSLFSVGAQAQISLVFGAYSSDKPSAMVAQVRPSLNIIAKKAGEIYGVEIEFRMQIVKSYKDGVDHLVTGKFDIMRLGPASYVMAKERAPEIGILVMENKRGRNTFNGIICVRNDSPLREMSELRGKSFAFGSSRSTLGRFFAQLHLMQAGVFARELDRFEYVGRHDKVGMVVGAGLFDAGALEETTFGKLVSNGVPIRALYKFPNATRPWVACAGLDPRLTDALRRAMLALTDAEALRALRFDGFLTGSDSDYDPTRDAIRRNPMFFAGFERATPTRQSRR